MARDVKDLAKKRHWRSVVARQQAGRQTIRGFCQGEGLSEPSFHWWRRELVRRGRQRHGSGRTASAPKTTVRAKRVDKASFVPISLVGNSAVIELELRDGMRVRILPGCDAQTLTTVLC